VTDYYYPYFNYEGTDYFNVSDTAGAHALELNLGYEIGGFSLSGNYIVNEAPGAGSVGGDTYIELGYSFENVSVFAGAGNGWHTSEEAGEDDEFGLVNIGISSSKEIKLSESFSLPVGVSVIWNPHAEKFFIVGMISF
jgi:hypothetical protein